MYFLLFLSLILLAISASIALITSISLIVYGIVKVPYVKTPKPGVDKMFQLAKIKPNEKVYDLGCGNGQFLFRAEKEFKAKAYGYELSPWPYFLAKTKQKLSKSQANIYFKNFLKQNLSQADVIFCFLMPGACQKLSAKLDKELTPKTRIISYGFGLLNLKNFLLIKKWYNKKTPIYYYENNQDTRNKQFPITKLK